MNIIDNIYYFLYNIYYTKNNIYYNNIMTNICILGTGWYGCHIASILKNKYNITIIEKNNDIFNNSSYYNQNRLHKGYHYCRDYNTRSLCNNNYNNFVNKYANVIDYIDNNYYLISNNSIIDYNTYTNIYNYEKFEFEEINNNLFSNIQNNIIKVNEHVINSDKAYKYFKDELKDINIIFNTKIISIIEQNNKVILTSEKNDIFNFDIVLDCTYNQLELSTKKYIYEKTISLLFKKIQNTEFDALTIMDGNFSSLYPRDIQNNIYTLTDVEYTPLIKSSNYKDIEEFCLTEEQLCEVKNKMINKINIYYPNFLNTFAYEGYFLSNKTKQVSSSDSRDITIEAISDKIITVNCGKIYGIFEWEEYVMNYLDNYNEMIHTKLNETKNDVFYYFNSPNRNLLTDINNNIIQIDNIKQVSNVTYIHFLRKQQKYLYFNSHFLLLNEKIYYANYFTNQHINNIILDPNSDENINFKQILKNNIYNELNLNKAIIIYINTNSPGNELARILYSIYLYYYHNLHDYSLVVSNDIFVLGNMIPSILYLFFDKSKIYFVDKFTKVNIKETYIYYPPSNKYDFAVKFLLNKLNETIIIEKNNLCNYENICLIKTTLNKNMNSPNRTFSNDYNIFFEKKGFKIINVENLEVLELFNLIKNCKNLVLSWGANSWCNSTFVNESHNLITLCHIGYEIEYNNLKKINNIEKCYSEWTPICNKNIMIYDLKSEFTDETKYLLENKLKEINVYL